MVGDREGVCLVQGFTVELNKWMAPQYLKQCLAHIWPPLLFDQRHIPACPGQQAWERGHFWLEGGLVLHSPSSPVLAEVVLADITWPHWLHAALQLPGLSLHGTLALWLWLQLLQLLLLGQPFSISGCGSKCDPEQDSVVASRIVGPESALRGLIAHYEVEVHPTARSLSKVVSAATILW